MNWIKSRFLKHKLDSLYVNGPWTNETQTVWITYVIITLITIGLSILEKCQLLKFYGGLTNGLRVFGLFNIFMSILSILVGTISWYRRSKLLFRKVSKYLNIIIHKTNIIIHILTN